MVQLASMRLGSALKSLRPSHNGKRVVRVGPSLPPPTPTRTSPRGGRIPPACPALPIRDAVRLGFRPNQHRRRHLAAGTLRAIRLWRASWMGKRGASDNVCVRTVRTCVDDGEDIRAGFRTKASRQSLARMSVHAVIRAIPNANFLTRARPSSIVWPRSAPGATRQSR